MRSLIIQQKSVEELSKLQKQFNNYVKRIQTLKKEAKEIENQLETAQIRIQKDIAPLEKNVLELRVECVKVFDTHYYDSYFKKAEKRKIADYILQHSHYLIEHGYDDLKEIYEKYSPQSFEKIDAEAEEMISEQMKEMMSQMFGIEFEEGVDVSSPEKMQEYMNQKMEQQQQAQEEKRANRKKSDAQLKKEEKARQELQNISKAARTIYTDLVKEFHPDKEPDEAKKERKTKLMHRITEAYEKDDLFELLNLKIELQGEKIENLTMADQQLKYYNKILKEQVQELDHHCYELRGGFSFGPNLYRSFCGTPQEIERKFSRETKRIQQEIIDLTDEIKLLKMPDMMRSFLMNRGKSRRTNSFF